ncbi:MAG TPA: VCBS repeat-containing protein, partial [Acidobacteriota bacterium]|nr:VCBS repeat-containing protein [Acidobacteriota bacterium]
MVVIGLVFGLVFLPGLHQGREWFGTSRANSQSPQFSPVQPVSILATGRGNPVVQVNDGQPAYHLTKSGVADDGSANLIPLALVAGDFNQDGVPDVVSTFTDGFQGMVNVHLGNLDGLYANSEEVQARVAAGQGSTDSFFPPLPTVTVPEPAQFVATGDFNFDGKMDLVTAANGGTALYWLAGNGQGSFTEAERIEVDGLITAFACGEFNQADGAVDLVVGVNRQEGAAVLVYESAANGLFGEPDVIPMGASIAGLALGRFNNDSWFDLATASGSSLVVVPGRDRLSVVNEPSLTAVRMSQRTFSEPLAGVTPGRFVNTTHDDIAVTTLSGQVLVLDDAARRRSLATTEEKPKKPILTPEPVWLEQWNIHELGWTNPGAKLVKTKTSSLPMDDLLTVGGGGQLRLLTAGLMVNQKLAELGTELAEFSAFIPPVAALPMRLNQDGLDDLVILSEGEQPLSKLTTTPMATFTVTNTGDNGGVDPAPSAGTGTLRQAIVDANANAGADMITFNIGGSGVQTITLAAALPAINGPVTIDGTTQPGSSTTTWPPTLLIELNGTSLTTGSGLSISGPATNCLLKGLIINRFTASDAVTSGLGIRNGGDNNTIQYNLIGTDSTGNTALSNRVG